MLTPIPYKIIWIDSIGFSNSDYCKKLMKGFDLVVINSKTRKEVLNKLEKTKAKFLLISGLHINIDNDIINAASNPLFIQQIGVGYEIFDLSLLSQKRISLCNTKGTSDQSVAELTIWLMLSVLRKLSLVERFLRKGIWKNNLREYCYELSGKTIGLIGCGNIGKKIASLLYPFNCEQIFYYKRNPMTILEEQNLRIKYIDLDKLLKTSDIISLHLPLSKKTRHLIDDRELNMMKRSSILINTSRGGIINEHALINALNNGVIKGAGLDVFDPEPPCKDNPLLKMENTVVTPHVGGSTYDSSKLKLKRAFLNIAQVANGERPNEDDIILDFFNLKRN